MAENDPLRDFQRLSEAIFLYTPPHTREEKVSLSASNAMEPGFLILCVWALAKPRHVAKYTNQYRTIYPGARILLLFNTIDNMTWRPDWMQMEDLQPAVWAVEDFLDSYTHKIAGEKGEDDQKSEATILVHMFSNGGSHSAVQLAQACRENIKSASSSSSVKPREIPISGLILDSCPGHATLDAAVRTALASIPKSDVLTRTIARPILLLFMSGCLLFHMLGIAESVVVKLWRSLNDSKGPFLIRQQRLNDNQRGDADTKETSPRRKIIPRTYIYSNRDDMVSARDVLEHAAIARRESGLDDDEARELICLEEFVDGMHVNHVSVDANRYWNTVRDTLKRSVAR